VIAALVFVIAVVAIAAAVVWAIGVSAEPTVMRVDRSDAGDYRQVAVLTPRQWLARALVRVDNLMFRHIGQGECIPPWYGLAWVRYESPRAILMLIPLNLIARALRAVWLWVKRGGIVVPASPAEAYDKGRLDERASWAGWQAGPLD
jgi:hypothetical protein